MAGSWGTLANAPPAQVATLFLLTDGTVLAQGVSTNRWYRLTPDANGSYANGTWATMANSVHAPLYYASGILRDGRLMRAHTAGRTHLPGYLDDHAAVGLGFVALWQLTFDRQWLDAARDIAAAMTTWFWDETANAFFTDEYVGRFKGIIDLKKRG